LSAEPFSDQRYFVVELTMKRSRTRVASILGRRLRYVVVFLPLLIIATILLYVAGGFGEKLQDMLINAGVALFGSFITYLIFDLILQRIEEYRIKEHLRIDLDRLIDSIAGANTRIRILETWTELLNERKRKSFLNAIAELLQRDVEVQIFLMNPDLKAVSDRSDQLKIDVQERIVENLRILDEFQEKNLGSPARMNLQVKMYNSLPSIALYQWDDRAFVSFFPRDTYANESSQLEIFMKTPLGDYITRKFDSDWADTETGTLATFMGLNVETLDSVGQRSYSDVKYVCVKEEYFIFNAGLIQDLINHKDVDSITISFNNDRFKLDRATADGLLNDRIRGLFQEKYNKVYESYIKLIKIS
jgi:hypothetical protein